VSIIQVLRRRTEREGGSMGSDPPELGKGLFGYRKSAVNQIIADRDIMLRQAEGRVRAAESKVAQMESELMSMRERNTRMDEQLDRLRQQLDTLVGGGQAVPVPQEQPMEPTQPEPEAWDEQAAAVDEAAYPPYGEQEPAEAHEQWPEADQEWPATDEAEAAPVVEAGVTEQPVEAVRNDDLPYGTEIRLSEEAAEETAGPAWMQDAEAAPVEEEQDEVAMAAGAYGYEDYAVQEQQGYGEFGSEEEEEEAESEVPSPFARFPFSPEPFGQEPFGQEPFEASSQEEAGADEPVPHLRAYESPAAEPEPVQEPQRPDPAASPTQSAVSPETTDITNRFLTEELTGILAAAEESATRIVERARATTQRQIARSNRVWREVQAEVSRFASWRQEVEPVIRNVQSRVDGVRSEIEEVPERIRQALAPMADAISSIDADLAELAAASNPPLLLTPSGLEAEGSDTDDWGLDSDPDDGFDYGGGGSDRTSTEHGTRSEEPYGESLRDSKDEGSGHLYAG
jgi:hypothetical protein